MPRSLIPKFARDFFKRQLGIQFLLEQNDQLQRRLTLLENKFYGSLDELEQDAKRRWRQSSPDTALTWSRQLSGTAFVRLAERYELFGPQNSVLEVGPGYGRLLLALQQEGIPFSQYLGVDISPNQVSYLTERFASDRIHFQLADVESFVADQQFDSLLSSLTFKHLFPSFARAMSNLSRSLKPGGRACIDFIEGRRRLFEDDGVTFIRQYTREEISELMQSCGFEVVAFEPVTHAEDFTRLAAVVEKSRQHPAPE